jgi:hypothetical protein
MGFALSSGDSKHFFGRCGKAAAMAAGKEKK